MTYGQNDSFLKLLIGKMTFQNDTLTVVNNILQKVLKVYSSTIVNIMRQSLAKVCKQFFSSQPNNFIRLATTNFGLLLSQILLTGGKVFFL
jgi:hypothetical protein